MIAISPTAPMNEAITISSRPDHDAKTSGLNPISTTPMNANAIPSQRRQWMRSPSISTDSSVANGTPS